MKKLLFTLFTISAIFTSCNKNENNASIVGDVYLVTQRSGENILYGLSLHAYSFYALSSVTVSPNAEPGTTYHLQEYPGFKTDFYYDTPESELSTEKPAPGNYHFTASFENGKTNEADDYLAADFLVPPVITSCSYDVSSEKATIEWETVTGADLYVIKLYEGDELVLLSPAIDPSVTKVEFNAASSSWGQNYTPATGTNFVARLSAFKYEAGGDSYNVQASTFADDNLLWGEE